MADEDELAAAHRSVEEMRERIGATSLHYLSLDGMQSATRLPEGSVCRACFTRDYPTSVPAGRPGEAAVRAGRAPELSWTSRERSRKNHSVNERQRPSAANSSRYVFA